MLKTEFHVLATTVDESIGGSFNKVAEMTLRPTNERTVEESLVSKRLMDSEWRAKSRTQRLRAKTQRELE